MIDIESDNNINISTLATKDSITITDQSNNSMSISWNTNTFSYLGHDIKCERTTLYETIQNTSLSFYAPGIHRNLALELLKLVYENPASRIFDTPENKALTFMRVLIMC